MQVQEIATVGRTTAADVQTVGYINSRFFSDDDLQTLREIGSSDYPMLMANKRGILYKSYWRDPSDDGSECLNMLMLRKHFGHDGHPIVKAFESARRSGINLVYISDKAPNMDIKDMLRYAPNQCLALSTGHMRHSDILMFERMATGDKSTSGANETSRSGSVFTRDTGVFINLCSFERSLEVEMPELSEEGRFVVQKAIDSGFCWLELDSDAPVISWLQTFDW